LAWTPSTIFLTKPSNKFSFEEDGCPSSQPSGFTDKGNKTQTPIQHVIVIIGENRTFDHVFATYKPSPGESVWNLLSKGIVNEDGTPGPNFSLASQSSATDSSTDG